MKKQTTLRVWISHSVFSLASSLKQWIVSLKQTPYPAKRFTGIRYSFGLPRSSAMRIWQKVTVFGVYIWKALKCGFHEFLRQNIFGQLSWNCHLHRARLLHQAVIKQHKCKKKNWQRFADRTAWPVGFSEWSFLQFSQMGKNDIVHQRCSISGWKSSKWFFVGTVSSLQAWWQGWSAVSQSKQKSDR